MNSGRILCGLGLSLGLLGGVGMGDVQRFPAQAQTASQGYVLLQKGWVNDAIAAFQQALKQNPQSLEARLGLAIAYQRAGKDSEAWESYRLVLQQDPKNRTALAAVGVLGGYRSEWQATGIEALSTLLELTPNDLGVRAQRALLLGYQGRFAESLADYDQVLKANPQPEMILGAAQIYTYSGDYQTGLSLFGQYLTLKRTLPDGAVTAYALALRESGQVEQAIQLLQTRLQSYAKLDYIGIDLRTNLAIAYQMNGQSAQALEILAPLRDKPEARLPLARALSEMGRQEENTVLYQEAIALYRQVLQQSSPPPANLVLEAADVMSETLADQAEALRLYEQLLQSQPNNLSLRVKQLVLAGRLNRISDNELTQQLQAIGQSLPTSLVEQKILAQTLGKLNPPHPGLRSTYETLIQAGVDVPFLHYRLAQIHLQEGNLEAAQQSIETYRTTRSGSQDLAVELLVAEIERRQGKLAASADRYTALLAKSPKRSIYDGALRGLAGIRQAQGRFQEAIEIYDQLLARNPADSRAQLGKINAAYQGKLISLSEAETQLETWLQAHPGETPPELFTLLSNLPADAKREELYKRLIALSPRNLGIQGRLLQVIAKRNLAEARSRVEELIAANPNDITPYFIKAELEQSLGNLRQASDAYQAILRRDPNNVAALSGLGGIRFQQKRFKEATALYRRVLTLLPNDWETRRILAELTAAQDYPMTALRQFQALEKERSSQGNPDLAMQERIERLQVDILKRRGFQPPWEQY
jgi:tetratricopeptide (TPR) repeat protein